MSWVKHGVLIEPPTHLEWAVSHAAVPFVQVLDDTSVRVWFTTRDSLRRSQIARAIVSFAGGGTPSVEIDERPALLPGPIGAFDDSGVMTSCLVEHEGIQYLYYQGWSLGVTVPFYVFTGLAVSEDGGHTFARISPAPVHGRSAIDPFMVSSPWVMRDGDGWRMWYVSGTGWTVRDGVAEHYNVHLKYAQSANLIEWESTGRVVLDYASEAEYAIARPVVIADDDGYRMWYSHRGDAYRVGYAESDDGLAWERRDDEAGIDVSETGWDSDMVEYACVFDIGGRRHMLYNGNGFGATGIGHAVWDPAPPRT
jgi:hypothetical protein